MLIAIDVVLLKEFDIGYQPGFFVLIHITCHVSSLNCMYQAVPPCLIHDNGTFYVVLWHFE